MLAPAPAAAQATPPLSYWQQQFNATIGPLGSDLSPALRAYRYAAFYGSLARARPDEFVWAGAASRTTGLLATFFAVGTIGGLPGMPTAPALNSAATVSGWGVATANLANANRAVAHDLGPVHLAYHHGGMTAINGLRTSGEISPDVAGAFGQIDTGARLIREGAVPAGQALVLGGNTALLHREQYGPVQTEAFGRDRAAWTLAAPMLSTAVDLAFATPEASLGSPYGVLDPSRREALGVGLMRTWQQEHRGGGNNVGGVELGRLGSIDYLATPEGLGPNALAFAVTAPGLAASADARPSAPPNPLAVDSLAGDALLDFLVVDPAELYVNLNPAAEDDVVPAAFRSSAGLASLAADRELKRTVATILSPKTEFGQRWWDAARPTGVGCSSARMWITLAPGARVWTNGTAHVVLDAPLRVQLEGDDLYLAERAGLSGDTCRPDPAEIDRYRDELLPLVERAVNEAPEYAPLRVVARARVLAELVAKAGQAPAVFHHAGCTGGRACHRLLADPEGPIAEIWRSYVESLRSGELRATETLRRGSQTVTRTIFYGGVDWSDATFDVVPDGELAASHPDLAPALVGALAGAIVARPGGGVLGGGVLLDLVPAPDLTQTGSWEPMSSPVEAPVSPTVGSGRRGRQVLRGLGWAVVAVGGSVAVAIGGAIAWRRRAW